MHQTDLRLVESMNLHTPAIIINQADSVDYESCSFPSGRIEMLTLPDRGVGKNRNMGLMRSAAQICLIADDDIRYDDDYAETVLQAFETHPEADVIAFNLDVSGGDRPLKYIARARRLTFVNGLGIGACRLAVRRESVLEKNIWFSLLFGGGARYGSGEDSLFIADCIRSGLRVIGVPDRLGVVALGDSSWFEGFNERYLYDKGVLFAHLGRSAGWIMGVAFCVKHRDLVQTHLTFERAVRTVLKGVSDARRRR